MGLREMGVKEMDRRCDHEGLREDPCLTTDWWESTRVPEVPPEDKFFTPL